MRNQFKRTFIKRLHYNHVEIVLSGREPLPDNQLKNLLETIQNQKAIVKLYPYTNIWCCEEEFKEFLTGLLNAYILNPDKYNNSDLSPIIEMIENMAKIRNISLDDPFYGDWVFEYGMKHPSSLGVISHYWMRPCYFYQKIWELIKIKNKVILISPHYDTNTNEKIALFIKSLGISYPKVYIHENLSPAKVQDLVLQFIKHDVVVSTHYNYAMQRLMYSVDDKIVSYGANSVSIAKMCVHDKMYAIDLNKLNARGKSIVMKAIIEQSI